MNELTIAWNDGREAKGMMLEDAARDMDSYEWEHEAIEQDCFDPRYGHYTKEVGTAHMIVGIKDEAFPTMLTIPVGADVEDGIELPNDLTAETLAPVLKEYLDELLPSYVIYDMDDEEEEVDVAFTTKLVSFFNTGKTLKVTVEWDLK